MSEIKTTKQIMNPDTRPIQIDYHHYNCGVCGCSHTTAYGAESCEHSPFFYNKKWVSVKSQIAFLKDLSDNFVLSNAGHNRVKERIKQLKGGRDEK